MTSSRRDFLRLMALSGGALVVGIRLTASAEPGEGESFRPDAWLRIEPDGSVVVQIGKSEMGQGVRTSLPMLVAEELDVDVESVRIEQASPGPDFDDLGTGGSSSHQDLWDPLRKAGAAARTMLVAAAAARWAVAAETCRTEGGSVIHGSQRLPYASLLKDAAMRPVPENPTTRTPDSFRVIGTSRKRIDAPKIVTGKATYGLDVRLPGMLYAVVARPPAFGRKMKSFDAAKARKFAGVRHVLEIPSGVAVVAENSWAAIRGRDALEVVWSESAESSFSSEDHLKKLAAATEEPGVTIRRDGRGRDGFSGAAKTLEALYLYPFAAHAAVEPVNCTARVTDDDCEIWSPTQTPNVVQLVGSRVLGIPESAVTVHVTLLGGGFGRRLWWDFDREAIEIAKQIKGTPVHLFWTRDDDMRHGYFQAAAAHRLRAGLDANGRVIAWEQRKASTPHNARRPYTEAQTTDADWVRSSAWGVYDSPYAIRDSEMTYRVVDAPVPIGPWRAVFAPSSVFARESFLDEIAVAVGRDPIQLRLALLGEGDETIAPTLQIGRETIDRPRLRKVIETVAAKSGWGDPVPRGVARGVACDVFHNGTLVAYVVDVSLRSRPSAWSLPFVVERVVCAIDCGVPINPNGIAQQVESGVIWSLSNMKGEITFEDGQARESNYDGFSVVTQDETPGAIEIHIVESGDSRPHGVGEPTVSPFAPAAASALSRLTGRRIRRLPVRPSDLVISE